MGKVILLLQFLWSSVWWQCIQSVCWCCRCAGPVCTYDSILFFISVINQLDAQNFCFTISLFHASICFEDHLLIIRRSKLYYTASGIITPIGGRLVHLLTVKQKFCVTSWLITEINILRCKVSKTSKKSSLFRINFNVNFNNPAIRAWVS